MIKLGSEYELTKDEARAILEAFSQAQKRIAKLESALKLYCAPRDIAGHCNCIACEALKEDEHG